MTLDALGEIMAGLVDAGAAVHGPQWSMAPTNPAYDQARARRRRGRPPPGAVVRHGARAVCGPGGVGGGAGLRRDPGPPVPLEAAVAPMAAAMVAAGDAEPERVTPAELTVRVDVEVGFTIVDTSGRNDLD